MIPPTDGGPAFPNAHFWEDNPSPGMSLRDWWAGLAMQGMMSNDAMTGSAGASRSGPRQDHAGIQQRRLSPPTRCWPNARATNECYGSEPAHGSAGKRHG